MSADVPQRRRVVAAAVVVGIHGAERGRGKFSGEGGAGAEEEDLKEPRV